MFLNIFFSYFNNHRKQANKRNQKNIPFVALGRPCPDEPARSLPAQWPSAHADTLDTATAAAARAGVHPLCRLGHHGFHRSSYSDVFIVCRNSFSLLSPSVTKPVGADQAKKTSFNSPTSTGSVREEDEREKNSSCEQCINSEYVREVGAGRSSTKQSLREQEFKCSTKVTRNVQLGSWALLSNCVGRKINRKTYIFQARFITRNSYQVFFLFFNTYASVYSNLIIVQINFVLIKLVCSSSCIWYSVIVYFINFNEYTLAYRVKIMDI